MYSRRSDRDQMLIEASPNDDNDSLVTVAVLVLVAVWSKEYRSNKKLLLKTLRVEMVRVGGCTFSPCTGCLQLLEILCVLVYLVSVFACDAVFSLYV